MSPRLHHQDPGALNVFTQIIRGIGLNIVNLISHRVRKQAETKKTVISTSFWIALRRCWVHFLPVSISIFLIQLNLRGYYFGKHLQGSTSSDRADSVILAFIQVAAKLLELLIVASFTDILIHVIRNGLLHGNGLPFGIATSGFSFDRLQYFWSPALWGGLWGFRKSSKLRGILIICVLAFGGFIALVAGPASAVLLLPRINTWKLFDTTAWLNGTNDQFWPEHLTSDHIGGDQCKRKPGLYCVNKLLPYLQAYYSISQNDFGYLISPPEQKYPRILNAVPRATGISAEAWSVAPHAATSFLLTSLWNDPWWHSLNGKPTEIVSGEIISKAAAVRTVCSRGVKSFDQNIPTIPLPLLPEYGTWAPDNYTDGPYINVSVSSADWKTQMTANPTTLSTVWIPASVNMTSTTVGIVVFDQQPINSSQRQGVVCSIDARWNKAKHLSSKSVWYGLNNQGNTISAALSSHHQSSPIIDGPLPIKNDKNWRHISADPEFFETLTYVVPANGDRLAQTEWLDSLGHGVNMSSDGGEANFADTTRTNTTYLGNILLTQVLSDDVTRTPWDPLRTITIETVISTVVADAISRIGLAHLWSTPSIYVNHGDNCSSSANSGSHPICPLPLNFDDPMVKLTFNGSLTGYAYKSSKPTDYIAITALSLYILAALIHILRLLITKRSSSCWDRVEDFVLLARTSDAPTKGTSLENTYAGISTFSTMALMTRIRNRAVNGNQDDREDLHLLIGKDASLIDCTEQVQEGKAYGAGVDSNHQIQVSQDSLPNVHDRTLDQAKKLIALLLSEDQPQAVITKAIRGSTASIQSKRRLCELLTRFGEELGANATNTSHGATALLVQARADHIATEGLKTYQNSTPASSTTSTNTKVGELSQGRVEAPSEGDGDRPYEKKSTQLSTEEDVKHSLLSSQAFSNLHNALCSKPEFLDSILRGIVQKDKNLEAKRMSEDVTAHDVV